MLQKYFQFIRGVAVNTIGKWGVVLTTSSFITFLILEAARLLGIFTNAYLGLITYLLFPALFVVGLVMIPFGWRQQLRATGKTTKELLSGQFEAKETAGHFLGSPLFQRIALFSLINVLFLVLAASQMLGFMDEAEFCGTACHSVMHPEWLSYQESPHARVKCVECHVGEGAGALLESKLNGAYQMLSITLKLYEKPIPTPVHNLRPARETCEKCHWPEKFYGNRLKTFVRYREDSLSTPTFTTLNMKVDAHRQAGQSGIHWHVGTENIVRYASFDERREQMLWVESRQPDGSFKRFVNTALKSRKAEKEQEPRVMDCVDCHNRATHVYEDPARAVDLRMEQGLINRDLPFIRREAVAAMLPVYPTKEAGLEGVRNHLTGFYRLNFPQVISSRMAELDEAIAAVQKIYNRNVHPEMNVQWHSYPNHLGHDAESGCFRCHNNRLLAEDGASISTDCTTCHSILAEESAESFRFLRPPDQTEPDYPRHQYLQEEFLNYSNPQ